MDIRKYFGAASTGQKTKEDKKESLKLSKTKTKKSEAKRPNANQRSKARDESAVENIVIDSHSSDEDVIESSLASDNNKNISNSKILEGQKDSGNKNSQSDISHERKRKKDSSKGSKTKQQEKLKDKEDNGHQSSQGDVAAKKSKSQSPKPRKASLSSEKRTSPRKGKSSTYSSQNSNSKESSQTSTFDIVEESSEEESPMKKKIKGKTSSLKRKPKLLESDSEEDPLPSEKAKKKKKNGGFAHDSDEDKTETALDKFVVHKSTPPSIKEKSEVKKSMPVNLTDFFGGASLSASRKERPTSSTKRKAENDDYVIEVPKGDFIFDKELHDDEDFMKTLDQLDGPKAKKNSSPSKDIISVKKGKAYTMEVTKTMGAATSKEPNQSKVETTPLKPKRTKESQKSSEKEKPESIKDDGFGLKTSNTFRAFKMRGGPLALGSKEIPEGEENCLEGLTFVITGVLDAIERDDVKSLVEKHGGRITGSISKKTSYLVIGREPGESKINKANDLSINKLDEDGLFELIRTLPSKTSKYKVKAKEQLKKEETMKAEQTTMASKKESFHFDKGKEKKVAMDDESHFTQLKNSETAMRKDETTSSSIQLKSEDHVSINQPEALLWVDKHKPTSLKQVIGQHGDKSNANKLLHWIKKWHENVIVKGLKPVGNFFSAKGDGAGFRAALLSGPPGIGKTTTATLVCKEVGFSYVELNASDTRSKRNLKEVIAESLNNQTVVDYMEQKTTEQGQSHCVIMDEVDGMAGNEDRGGLQELVQLIKSSKIPIICICNDRNSMKMRTLSNYCFDLRFSRPRVEQIKGAMMTLTFREGLKIPPAAIQEIILASNHDIRQIIHNLSMWSAGDKQMTYEQVKSDAQKAQKDVKMGPFDVCRKVFVTDESTSKMTINDKSDLFFHDYSFGPLFVQENYPHVIPAAARDDKKRHMACLAHTIDSLCDGDLIEKLIRKGGNWNLLPVQAMYSSVIPGDYMRGKFPQMPEFPSWLGKNSSTGKTERILQELNRHMHLQVSCDKRGLNLDYLPALRVRLTSPLLEEGSDGVANVIDMMDDYDIIKEDFDNIMEITKWPHSFDPLCHLESKTKAAFTRQYNKGSHATPYSTGNASKKKKVNISANDERILLVEPENELPVIESEDDDEPAVVVKSKAGKGKGQQVAGKRKGQQVAGKGKGAKGKR